MMTAVLVRRRGCRVLLGTPGGRGDGFGGTNATWVYTIYAALQLHGRDTLAGVPALAAGFFLGFSFGVSGTSTGKPCAGTGCTKHRGGEVGPGFVFPFELVDSISQDECLIRSPACMNEFGRLGRWA